MENMMIIPAELVTTPVGQKSPERVKTLKPEMLKSDKIKEFAK
jgi:branched-chain amino acid transport system substrate-binding protein